MKKKDFSPDGDPTAFMKIKRLVDERLNDIAEKNGEAVNDWDAADWEFIARIYVGFWILSMDARKQMDEIATGFVKLQEEARAHRQAIGKRRVETRGDQLDKVAFQKAVKANIDDYNEIRDAIDDLKIKPQFQKYVDQTLWAWTREIWTKPIKKGRRKNK